MRCCSEFERSLKVGVKVMVCLTIDTTESLNGGVMSPISYLDLDLLGGYMSANCNFFTEK